MNEDEFSWVTQHFKGPAFVAQKSGIGRKTGNISSGLKSGEGYVEFAKGMTNLPQNLVGAPMDISNMVAGVYGGGVDKPFMGSEYLKEKTRNAGLSFRPPDDPALSGFYGAGDLGSNAVNPAGATRAGLAQSLQAARLARQAAMQAGRGGKAVLNMAGEEMSNRLLSGRSTIPGVPSAFAPSPLKFAVEPGGPRQELTNQMRELLAQRKLLQAGPQMNALNLELSSLQQQFKEMPAVQRVAKEVVAPQVTAPVSDIGFYSAAEQASQNLARQSGTGEAFLNDLMKVPDVKKEELAWTGLDDFLRGKQNVTKKEVQDFIAANKVDVQEVQLGGVLSPELQMTRDALNNKYKALVDNIADAKSQFEEGKISYAELRNTVSTNKVQTEALDSQINEINKTIAPTKHERWQLPGGENYREILLTLPSKPMDASMAAENFYTQFIKRGGEPEWPQLSPVRQKEIMKSMPEEAKNYSASPSYTSSHFNEPNILAHMRVNDRIDAEGKKMLLIEEVQSDWHQAGRKGGYAGENQKALLANQTRLGEIDKILATAKYTPEEGSKLLNEQGKLVKEYAELESKRARGGDVPDAPFKDTWHQVALKRALKYAADNGYERVGLTTGKQQIDRYSNELRQNVSEINFQTGQKLTTGETAELQAYRQQKTPMTGSERRRYEYLSANEGEYVGKGQTKIRAYNGSKSTFTGTVADGKFIDGPGVGKTVEEVLGKTMAKQIAEQRTGNIRGDDLTIGGEGMKAYYDEIYPAFLDKQSKKWNAKTGETTIGKKGTTEKAGVNYYQTPDTSAKVRYIDITPEMKGALAQGQPLHGLIPAIPAAGFGVEGMNRQQNSLAPPTNNALFLSGAGP